MVTLLSLYVLFAPTSGGPSLFPGADKAVHLGLFALLAGTARWWFGARDGALLAVLAYAVLSEVVQGALLANRSGDAYDVVADALGVVLGWVLAGRALSR